MRVRVPPSAHKLANIGDEFDGRMSALGAEGTGFNSRVPDKLIIFLVSSKLKFGRKKVI